MKKKCFVIMPFSKTSDKHDELYWNKFFELIQQTMESNSFECKRSEIGPYSISSNIVSNLEESDIVVAVLTDFNANVWYELGIRHTLRQGTIMLLQNDQKPPFDIRDYGIILYQDSLTTLEDLVLKIENYIMKIDGNISDSPVLTHIKGYSTSIYGKVNKHDKKITELEATQNLFWQMLCDHSQKRTDEHTRNKHTYNRILWVDDYPSNNRHIISLFESKKIQFDIALTTEQGMELYKHHLYDAIITDMGRDDERDAGLSLLKELNFKKCKTPIILYASSYAISTYGDQAINLGVSTVTSKPTVVISALSKILGITE